MKGDLTGFEWCLTIKDDVAAAPKLTALDDGTINLTAANAYHLSPRGDVIKASKINLTGSWVRGVDPVTHASATGGDGNTNTGWEPWRKPVLFIFNDQGGHDATRGIRRRRDLTEQPSIAAERVVLLGLRVPHESTIDAETVHVRQPVRHRRAVRRFGRRRAEKAVRVEEGKHPIHGFYLSGNRLSLEPDCVVRRDLRVSAHLPACPTVAADLTDPARQQRLGLSP
jgi:hypothetical protein